MTENTKCYMDEVITLRKRLNVLIGFMAREWFKDDKHKQSNLLFLADLIGAYDIVDEWFDEGAEFCPHDFEWVLNGINGIIDAMIKNETYVFDGFSAIREILHIAGYEPR